MRIHTLFLLFALTACSGQKPADDPTPVEPTTDVEPDAPETAPVEPEDEDPRRDYGKFVRVELVTEKVEEASTFYGALFGWQVRKDGGDTVLEVDGREMARARPPASDDVPIGWMSWISVAEIDDLMRDVAANGGEVIVAPYDGPSGRMAVLRGPTGGVFGAVELTNPTSGDRRAGEGQLGMSQLWTPDYDVATNFYRVVGNYTSVEVAFESTRYTVLRDENDEPRALIRLAPKDQSARWIPFVIAADVDAQTEKAKSLGGTVITAPRNIETLGRVAVIQAPTGGIFGLISADVWQDFE